MESRLKKITTGYHTFVENQVLTEHQLNEFVTYLDDQNRLTKVFLHGVGIVCGFELEVEEQKTNSDKNIVITQGVGISTDGDLMQFKTPADSDKRAKLLQELQVFSHYKKFSDENANYPPLHKNDEPIDMWEIFTEGGNGAKKLNKLTLEDKVVVLYLESYANPGNLCTTIDCDNQGIEQVEKLRVILVNEKDIAHITKNDELYKWHNISEKYTQLPEIKTPRVILQNVSGLSVLRQRYLNVFSQTLMSNLKEGFDSIYQIIGQKSISKELDECFKLTKKEQLKSTDFQYRYDLLCDLVDSYNELKDLLLKINVECCPGINSFEKHLLLGSLYNKVDYVRHRHGIYKSPLSAEETKNRAKVASILQRVKCMLNSYSFHEKEAVEDIKITPSVQGVELGEKSIPYYYQLNENFIKHWSFEKTQKLKHKLNLSYSIHKLANIPVIQTPLKFRNERHNFYRIEGHLGLDALACRDKIQEQVRECGLNFTCQVIALDSKEKDWGTFLKKHPGLEHGAGVVKGGTFLLVANENKVVADFYMPYRIEPEMVQPDCYSLMECSFPWISSLKYLNNLARSIKGTQSRNKPMPKNYLLQVVEYRINGTNLINGATTISIPLSQIFLRRMHAITEALNNRFNTGVVFDYNESQKRFVITRVKDDAFVLRVRDISLNYNNPIYTYSNNGMFRNNKVFRADAMMCRDLRKFNPEFYANLHEQIAPQNKDDDYGKFNDKWKKWNLLKERLINHEEIKRLKYKRFISQFSELPAEIKRTIAAIKADFQNLTNNDLTFKLDGDWVNGEWVDNKILDYYKKNKKNTHDDVVLFVNLRKYLHSETGQTKLSIYIKNLDYNDDMNSVIEKYNTVADIYFGAPSGENAINL